MSADLDLYRDREHSYIKHQFLTQYLQAAAYKTLQGVSPIFNFVDAFAGPWSVSDSAKYSDASFDQAINTLEAVRADLGRSGVAGLRIRFCFCERRADAVLKLREYAQQKKQFEIHIFEGAFEDNLDAIARAIPNGFTFTFIDPTGWDIRSKSVFQFLRDRRGEFLLNFMADHINRHTEYSKVEASFGRFLADPDWAGEFAALPESWSNEQCVLHLLKSKMQANGVATYLPDFSIMVPRKERVKMRLILGTHSPKGLEVFRDVQSKVERQEIEMRTNLRDGENPQVSLFTVADIVAMQQESKGVGCKRYQQMAEDRIKTLLENKPFAFFGPLALDVIEAIPMRLTQVRALVGDLKKRNVVTFELPLGKRVPQELTEVSLCR